MQIPQELLDSLSGLKGFDREAFEAVHNSGTQEASIRMNPAKPLPAGDVLQGMTPVPWSGAGFYLLERPSFTFDPLFHAGCYYVQEASSMFLEQAMKQCVDLTETLRVLDLCAAPGGKTTHLQSMVTKDSLVVSNEVIKSRTNILVDNIIKWGAGNVVVTQNDPKEIGRLGNFFDVMVVDAPCSGSGLFRRDESAIDQWSPNTIALCCQRQERILADAWPCLRQGGILVYSTCSYSPEENEDVCDWLLENFDAEPVALKVDPNWGIIETKSPIKDAAGYRFFPDKLRGEGFFLSCFRKIAGKDNKAKSSKKTALAGRKESEVLEGFVRPGNYRFINHGRHMHAIDEALLPPVSLVLNSLRTWYFGTILGELVRGKLVPHHALAMSLIVSDKIMRIPLDRQEATKYLQKKEIILNNHDKGWQLVSYHDLNLGWINVLSNRVNNYYPKELRILREGPE